MQLTRQEQRNKHLQEEIDRFNKYYKEAYEEAQDGVILTLDLVDKVEEAFSKQGHSGFSANYCFNYLKSLADNPVKTLEKLKEMLTFDDGDSLQNLITSQILEIYDMIKEYTPVIQKAVVKLLDYKPLTPLLGTEDEWVKCDWYDEADKYEVYSNVRCSGVYKYVMPNGIEICTYLDDVCYSDNGGYTHFTTGRFGRRQITFPFEIPEKPEVVYLYEVEGITPFILTDPDTIAKVKEVYLKERGDE